MTDADPPSDEPECLKEADKRADQYKYEDPYPEIEPSLLSREHIIQYANTTGMVFPFVNNKSRLKTASYEINPGGRFIYWDVSGKKIDKEIHAEGTYELPANSITFVQMELRFHLPYYIAVRFNLRIQHVHRGLLLGTGPLVDPGFYGNLLIPVHNLTSDPYTIRGGEGLIWAEFTKTTYRRTGAPPLKIAPSEEKIEEVSRKSGQPPEYFFDKANKNRPIRSSIPQSISEARKSASVAEKSAKDAKRANSIFVGIGILAIAGTVIGLFSLFESIKGNVMAANNLAGIVNTIATRSMAVADSAQNDADELKEMINAIVDDRQRVSTEVRQVNDQIQEMNQQIEELRQEMQRLLEQNPTQLEQPEQ